MFSIVIPTYNNWSELERCLNSLAKLEGELYELLICVDGSTDETVAMLNEWQSPVPIRVLEHPGGENRGRSATRNLALPYIQGTYTLFLDSDMEVPTDLLQRHQNVLSQGNTVSIGGVRYRNEAQNLWARYTSERGVAKFPPGGEVPFNYFITANTAVRSEWFRGCDGFDELIRHYGGEDMELGYRIHLKYDPCYVYNPAASVYTIQEKPLGTALAQLEEYGRTGLRYITKKFPALKKIYWVEKCDSRKLKDQLFEILTQPFFRKPMRALLPLLPYALQKQVINYLVISHVHAGYRAGKSESAE